MQVWVATYEHKHGTDTRVFAAATSASRWKQEIAAKWWDETMSEEKPSDSAEMANRYFDVAESFGEFFNVELLEVE